MVKISLNNKTRAMLHMVLLNDLKLQEYGLKLFSAKDMNELEGICVLQKWCTQVTEDQHSSAELKDEYANLLFTILKHYAPIGCSPGWNPEYYILLQELQNVDPTITKNAFPDPPPKEKADE